MTVQAVLDQPRSPANDDVTGAGTPASAQPEKEPLTGTESLDQLVHAAMAR
ncbi:hypothetical protein ABIF26_004932 [Bradyrhizobium elkanii]